MSACATCEAEDQDEREAAGLEALEGRTSWRKAAQNAGLSHHAGLKAHMERHYAHPATVAEVVKDDYEALILQTLSELQGQMRLAPPELKPLFAVAITNLAGLKDTKPSQQNLIAALKAIHEIVGMKVEQRLMLQFGNAKFGKAAVTAPEVLELTP